MPKQKMEALPQLVAPKTTCGERPPTEFVGSPAAGGPLALVKNGDLIELDVAQVVVMRRHTARWRERRRVRLGHAARRSLCAHKRRRRQHQQQAQDEADEACAQAAFHV